MNWINSGTAVHFHEPTLMFCSVSLDAQDLKAKVILNKDFLFPLPLRIIEARHTYDDQLIFTSKRDIVQHARHYLPTSTPTALLRRDGTPYVPNFNTLPDEYERPDNFFTISFVSAEGEHFQYAGVFDTVIEFECDDDKYLLELDLGVNMEAGVTASPGGELYEFAIERMVLHTGTIRQDIADNPRAIRRLFVRYGPSLEFTCLQYDHDDKSVEFRNASGVGIENIELHGI
jgi:hypothetical protein